MSSKKRVGQGTGSAGGQSCFATTEEQQPQDKSSLGGLELKRHRMTSLDERSLADDEGLLGSCDQPGSGYSSSGDIAMVLSRVGAVPSPGQQMSAECCEEIKGTEVKTPLNVATSTKEIQAVGSCLKVIIQQKSESRAFRQTDEQTDRLTDTQTGGYYCHVCHSSCPSLQTFQCHMSGQEHQKRLAKITDLNNTSHALHSRGRRPAMQRWCDTCQSHFSGDVVIHRQTKQHKLCKQSSRPFCSVCQRHFRSPRKFVEHMKSPEHKQQVLQEEPLEEELITVDAVGCFKEEEEQNRRQDEENGKMKETAEREEMEDVHDSDPDSSYGSSFVVPVSGFLCRLCNKFFHHETTARHAHCHTHTTSTCRTTDHKGQTHTPVDTDKRTQTHVHTPKHRHKQRK